MFSVLSVGAISSISSIFTAKNLLFESKSMNFRLSNREKLSFHCFIDFSRMRRVSALAGIITKDI